MRKNIMKKAIRQLILYVASLKNESLGQIEKLFTDKFKC